MLEIQRLACGVVGRVLAGRSLDAELAALWSRERGLTAQQRAAIQDACFGTLRFLGRLDAMLDVLLERPVQDQRLRHLLRVALYQLEYTRAAPHAVVDHAVRACGALELPAAGRLANGVLRNFLRRRGAVQAAASRSDCGRYSYPQWWIDRLRRQYPERYAQILDAGNRHPPLTLRVNRRRQTREAALAALAARGIGASAVGDDGIVLEKPLPVDRIPGFAEGLVSVQDAAAQRAARLLDLRAGMRVLDACAAPGGKTAHLLELADIELVSVDRDAARLERVRANLARLGLNARLVCADAAARDWWDGRPFDRVLADVPCSASGVVRRHPDIKWLRREQDIERFAHSQAALMDALWQLLAKDGKLLYATCSVFHEENHLQVARFLERQTDARRLSLPGADQDFLQQPAGQILPDERHDGFYYALLAKA